MDPLTLDSDPLPVLVQLLLLLSLAWLAKRGVRADPLAELLGSVGPEDPQRR